MTLIRVDHIDHSAVYAQNKTEKREILSNLDGPRFSFLIAWTGEYTTNIFHVTDSDLAKWITEDKRR